MNTKSHISAPELLLATRRRIRGYTVKRGLERTTGFVIYVVIVLFAFLSVFPFLWMFSTSFKDTLSNIEYPPRLIPLEPTLLNYRDLFLQFDYFVWPEWAYSRTAVVQQHGGLRVR